MFSGIANDDDDNMDVESQNVNCKDSSERNQVEGYGREKRIQAELSEKDDRFVTGVQQNS